MAQEIRILGLGIGSFLIALFVLLWIVLAALSFVFRNRWLNVSGFVALVIVVLVLVLSPRASPSQSSNAVPPGADPIYSTFYVGLGLMGAAMIVGGLAAAVLLAFHTLPKVRWPKSVD